jgi:hypothetical protein
MRPRMIGRNVDGVGSAAAFKHAFGCAISRGWCYRDRGTHQRIDGFIVGTFVGTPGLALHVHVGHPLR